MSCYRLRAHVTVRDANGAKPNRRRKDANDLPARRREIRARTELNSLPRSPQPASGNVADTTNERLQRLVGRNQYSLRALASLLEEYAAAWQDSSAFDKLAEGAEAEFFRFEEDQVRAHVDGDCLLVLFLALLTLQPPAFVVTLEKERLLFTSAPSEVLDHSTALRPHRVHDRATYSPRYQ